MREFKFRVWCKNNKEWEKDECFLTNTGTLLQYRRTGMIPCSLETHEISMYTGLNDKNNTPIYEGDILKDSEGTSEVIFVNGAFYAKFPEDQDILWEYL